MKHYLLTLLLMMAALTAMGQQTVSVADAKAKAAAFLNRSAGAKGGTVTTDVQLAYTAQQGNETYYYVFNNGSDGQGGFVIIGGDETARTILGYSDRGAFDITTAPENVKWWLSQYEQQISAAIKSGGTTSAAKGGMGSVKSIARADIPYFVSTEWDQIAPYNTAIPWVYLSTPDYTSDDALATGCVATAAAQIMKYYKYPTKGTGSNTCTTRLNGVTFSADFGSTTYQWGKMTNTYGYDTYSGTEAENAVATLMYHCGVAADMLYGQIGGKGSQAYTTNMGAGLIKYFGYDKGMTRETRDEYTDDEWAEIIYSELAAGRPVLYGGQTISNAGHAFVCSGYKNEEGYDMFHMNWGWSGNYNGYFPLQGTANGKTALKPDGTGTGGAAAGSAYDHGQEIIIGIMPDDGGAPKVTCNSLTLRNNNISPGNSLGIDMSITNNSFLTLNFTVGLKLVNKSTDEVTYLEYTTNQFEKSWGQGSIFTDYASTELTLAGGAYTVYPVYKDNEGNWHPLIYSFEEPTLNVIGLDEGPIVNGAQTISNNGHVTPSTGTFTVTIWNNSSYDMENATFTAYVWRDGKSPNVGSIDTNVTIPAHETKNVVFDIADYFYEGYTGGEALVAGNTYSTRVYYSGSPVRESSNINFQCTAEQSIDYKLSSVGWGTLCLPFSAEKPAGLTLYEVTGTDGNELTKTEVDKIEINKAYLVSGTAGTYNFTGPTTPTGQYQKNGLLVGNTASGDVYVPVGSYVMQNLTSKSGLAFYRVAAATQRCSQYKAYLTLPVGLSLLYSSLLFTDGTTGIESIEATDNQQGAVRKVMKNGRLTIETPQGSFTPAGARMK